MALILVLDDIEYRDRFEADLRSEYNFDLGDFYKEDSEVSVRWLVNKLSYLPQTSRLVSYISEDAFSQEDHLLTSILDVLDHIHFQTAISAAATLGSDQWKSIQEDAPTGRLRPGKRTKIEDEEVVEAAPVKFSSGKELSALNIGATKIIIAHTPECVLSEVNKAGEVPRCGCPPE